MLSPLLLLFQLYSHFLPLLFTPFCFLRAHRHCHYCHYLPLCSVSSGNLLSSLSLCHFLILFIFFSFPLMTTCLLPSSHHPASSSYTFFPMSCTRTPAPASTTGCVVLVEKPLSLPGPTSTWHLFLQSVPFIC